VGQGLTTVVQTREHTLVWDAGPKYSDSFNAGTATVLPFLQEQGIKSLDTLMIYHADNDHKDGAKLLITKITVDTLLMSMPNHKLPNTLPCLASQSWQWNQVYFAVF
jgi:competence protein ComEC